MNKNAIYAYYRYVQRMMIQRRIPREQQEWLSNVYFKLKPFSR